MAAKKGNRYAEKWTVETVTAKLAEMEDYVKNSDCVYLGSLLVKFGLYKDIWAYWKKVFSDNDEVFRATKRIEEIFEVRLFEGALTGKFTASVAIFGLKNNHNWKDKQEIQGQVHIVWQETKTYAPKS